MMTFSELSPQKRLLNFEEYTPAKVDVGCDINGWLQTYKKKTVCDKKRPTKILHVRMNVQKMHKQNSIPFTKNAKPQNNLKPYNNANTLSVTKIKLQIQAFSTKCKTSEIKRTSNERHLFIQERQTTQFNIRQFEQNHEEMVLQKKFRNVEDNFLRIEEMPSDFIHSKAPVSLTDRLEERKRRMNKMLSYNKMKNTKNQCQFKNGISAFSRKLSLINRSQQIIKGKLSANQRNALNVMLRKSENIEQILSKNVANSLKVQKQNKIGSYKFFSNQHVKQPDVIQIKEA